MLLRFFEPLDIFKKYFILYYRERRQQTSILGIIFSIFIFTFLIYQFVNSELFRKRSPNAITQSFAGTNSESIDFSNNRVLLMAVANSQLNRIADRSLFRIVAVYFNNKNTTIKEIEQCTYDHLKGSMNLSYFNALDLQNAYCFNDPNLNIEGFVDEYNWKWIQIYLYPCDNVTSNNTCKSPEVITEELKGKLFTVNFPSVQIDANDYENPLKTNYDPIVINLDPSILKSNIHYLKNVEVSTDDGWLFAETNVWKTYGITLDLYRLDYALRINEDEPLVDWKLLASKQKLKCSRIYQKLPETLASLAGMANLFIFFGFFVTNFFIHIHSLKYVLNKLYYFDYEEDSDKAYNNIKSEEQASQHKEISKEPPKKSGFLKLHTQSTPIKQKLDQRENEIKTKKNEDIFTNDFHSQPKELKQDSFILENYSKENENPDNCDIIHPPEHTTIPINKPLQCEKLKTLQMQNLNSLNSVEDIKNPTPVKTKLQFSSIDYLKYALKKLFCLKKDKVEKIIHKAEKIYKDELDATNMLKKLHEIENLKKLLLSPDQLNLFNYLTKPHVSLNPSKTEGKLARETITKGKFLESYKRCEEARSSCQISKKLVELCDYTLIK